MTAPSLEDGRGAGINGLDIVGESLVSRHRHHGIHVVNTYSLPKQTRHNIARAASQGIAPRRLCRC